MKSRLEFSCQTRQEYLSTVPAKELVDYASRLRRILFLLFLCRSYGCLMEKKVAYIDQRRANS
jgi:hypothetical protein